MAMTLGNQTEEDLMTEINTTPLIDVMLVLLVMLIITIPIQTHAVKLNMPNTPPLVPHVPIVVTIDIDAEGRVFWNGELVNDDSLKTGLASIASQSEQDEIHVHPDRRVPYEAVAHVLAMAQRLGAHKLGITGNEQFLDE